MSSSERHILVTRDLEYISTWDEWRTLWDEAKHVEILYGLLHIGFAVSASQEEAQERVILYLQIADGHAVSCEFKTPSSESGWYYAFHSRSTTPLRAGWPDGTLRAVSQKAFTVLCRDFFADPDRNKVGHAPSWARLALSRPVLETLRWFFRLRDRVPGTSLLRNLEPDFSGTLGKHYIQAGEHFARDLAEWIFVRRDDCREDYREMLDEFKPTAVDIWASLGILDLLLRSEYREYVDERCLKRLEELAMRCELYRGGKFHPVENIEQACLADSQAGKILLLLRVMAKEQKRVRHIEALERRRADAERQLQQLKS